MRVMPACSEHLRTVALIVLFASESPSFIVSMPPVAGISALHCHHAAAFQVPSE